MANAFEKILARYGRAVHILPDGEEPGLIALALVQPIRERVAQQAPSPLGWGRRERHLYLGEAEVPLEVGPQGFVRVDGEEFEVFSARKVCLGREGSHWWGILTSREGTV